MTEHDDSDSHHPGPPRFLQLGESIADPIYVDMEHGYDRDNLAPTITGTPERDPDPYRKETFVWRLREKPEGSKAGLEYAPTPFENDAEQYDEGTHNTAEFEPDKSGTYVFELDAPDGTHELTIEVVPPPVTEDGTELFDIEDELPTDAREATGGPPRLALDGAYDADAGEFVIESNPELAPDSYAAPEDLAVLVLPHDAASLDRDEIDVEGNTARVPIEALDEPTRVFAAPYDGVRLGTTDEIVLDPDETSVSYPNRAPEWLDDAVVYEIFTRSFAGQKGETDFEFLTEKVEYLDELGIDLLWLTPIVPAWSGTADTPPGGPHGYDTSDYFTVAEDLGTIEAFEAFVETCHDHDIKVAFDLVANHVGWDHAYWQDTIADLGDGPEDPNGFPEVDAWDTDSPYFDWFDRQSRTNGIDATPAQTSFFDVRLHPNLNYGNLALREHILAVVDFWSDIVDAFRCDIAWGVPHSFWTEARRLTREKDEAFLWLDESIPRIPEMGESEFDLHFDSTEFMRTAHAVARGERPPKDLIGAIEVRQNDGFPSYSRLINATENHDESRLYYEATANGHRTDPAAAQRAALAAAFTLPGVPFLYYGQERLISEYGERRESPYAGREDQTGDIKADPYKRAFMNWAEYDAPHLEFVSALVDFYHESPVLGPEATLVREAHRAAAGDDVLVFGRDAGEEKRVVVINFADHSHWVDLRLPVETHDLFTGEDLLVDRKDDAVTVEVETLAVFETPTLFEQGGNYWHEDEPLPNDP
ncbi:alpha-amylase [Halorhabdus sp. CBA1104]|uniref:alpha-amylase family glycosyl hydrolase n=1 Tax=Halorhabdus sp. CBA1104 TaxID=1380432 RepID=UPI0012B22C25|nr:alpha-amylase family glycosyl hydrolase [Halorhabdus sp. CBA1104]QGN07626.1 alpha-amylase [Halorhabdus sp. CBA1104]